MPSATIPSIIKFKRGPKATIPTLLEGEPGFTKDSKEIAIGTADGNMFVPKMEWVRAEAGEDGVAPYWPAVRLSWNIDDNTWDDEEEIWLFDPNDDEPTFTEDRKYLAKFMELDEDDIPVYATTCCESGSGSVPTDPNIIQSQCCPDGVLVDRSIPLTLTMVSTGVDPDWFIAEIVLDPLGSPPADLEWDKVEGDWRYYVHCLTDGGFLQLTIQSSQPGNPSCSFTFGGVIVSCDPVQFTWDYGSTSECNSPINDPYDCPAITGVQ